MGLLKKKAQEFVTTTPADMTSGDGMIQLDQMDEADVRHERCPMCKFNPLDRVDGFKVCPRCETTFKILDGNGYIIDYRRSEIAPKNPVIQQERGEMTQMSNRIVARMQKMAGGEYAVDMNKLKAIPINEIESTIRGCYEGDPHTANEKMICETIWEMIQDNFDVFTNNSSSQYLPMTPEIKAFINEHDLMDAATTLE